MVAAARRSSKFGSWALDVAPFGAPNFVARWPAQPLEIGVIQFRRSVVAAKPSVAW